jgi:hypothetical protein
VSEVNGDSNAVLEYHNADRNVDSHCGVKEGKGRILLEIGLEVSSPPL